MQRLYKCSLIIFLFLFQSCADAEMTKTEANDLLIKAYILKSFECKTQPPYPIFTLGKPYETGVNLCAFSIIRSDCPFIDYPLICLEVFKIDVPSIGQKIQKSKIQLK